MADPYKVAIFGGGIAGLTVAHELIERGYEVTVYERNADCGGKARSLVTATGQIGTRASPGLPAEHGFRFFPGFYQHLDDTMKRIPIGPLSYGQVTGPSSAPISASTAYDNLVDATKFGIAQVGEPLFILPTSNPQTLAEWVTALDDFFGQPELGLSSGEKEVLLGKLLRLFAMCRERREAELEGTPWYKYHNDPPPALSDQYNKMFVTGFSRALVAMEATEASTFVGANILAQFFRVFFNKSTMDRVLNAPTNDAWITPWVDYLKHKGVKFRTKHELIKLEVNTESDAMWIDSATVEDLDSGSTILVEDVDCYVAAVPVEVMQRLVASNPDLEAEPHLKELYNLETTSMTGIMFYLNHDRPIVHGHLNFADSKWALTGISQPQFWEKDLSEYSGDESYLGLLSIVISDWNTPDEEATPKAAKQCTDADDVAKRTWTQLQAHIPTLPLQTPDYFLDSAITFNGPSSEPVENAEPFMTNKAGHLKWRPPAETDIDNLVLASDYVRTDIDLATMEGANEAGRRAANVINEKWYSGYEDCDVRPYPEPKTFAWYHPIDKKAMDLGLPFSFGLFPFP